MITYSKKGKRAQKLNLEALKLWESFKSPSEVKRAKRKEEKTVTETLSSLDNNDRLDVTADLVEAPTAAADSTDPSDDLAAKLNQVSIYYEASPEMSKMAKDFDIGELNNKVDQSFSIYHECSDSNHSVHPENGGLDLYLEKSLEDLLDLAAQKQPMLFEEYFQNCLPFKKVFSAVVLANNKQIGEASYSDVYLTRGCIQEAIKIIPLCGQDQLDMTSAWLELVCSIKVASIKQRKDDDTNHFVRLRRFGIVQDKYSPHLINLFERYEANAESENVHPAEYPPDQLYLILNMEYGGKDLENTLLLSDIKTNTRPISVILQLIISLAQAERQLALEHRDLHWGNILVASYGKKTIHFDYETSQGVVEQIAFDSGSCKVTIIDLTLARMIVDKQIVYNDLENDPGLFEGPENDDYSLLHFSIYRRMRTICEGRFERQDFKTNVCWLVYLIGVISELSGFKEIKNLADTIQHFKSASEIVQNEILMKTGVFYEYVILKR